MRKKIYHYTAKIRLNEIISSGVINLSKASTWNKKEKPVAWVSTSPIWEATASKILLDRFGNQTQLNFKTQNETIGCARIEIKDTNLMSWYKLKQTAMMDLIAARGFEESGKKLGGNPNDWFGSLSPIKKSNWIKAEVFQDDEWKTVIVF